MFILFRTGLRIGEFCGLTLKDIDLEKRTINVNHQLQYVGSRGKYIEKQKLKLGHEYCQCRMKFMQHSRG